MKYDQQIADDFAKNLSHIFSYTTEINVPAEEDPSDDEAHFLVTSPTQFRTQSSPTTSAYGTPTDPKEKSKPSYKMPPIK